jgi:hypothetical protein
VFHEGHAEVLSTGNAISLEGRKSGAPKGFCESPQKEDASRISAAGV